MAKKHKQKVMIEKLVNGLKQCQVSKEPDPPACIPTGNTVLENDIKPELLAKWPKLNLKIPPIFLHKPVDFEQHVKKVLNMGIKFYQPHLGKNYIKIRCESFNDQKYLIQYLEKKQLPFHTFGNASKRKLKVVIRGIPKDTNLSIIKEALKSVSIPVIRVHKMHTKEERKDNTMLVLAVVPYDEQGKAILKITQLLGHTVKLEPPIIKPMQCYRCQKWGHSQRYCHGQVKCVKCGGDHLYKKCKKSEKEPPKCANCSEDHTASYKNCIFAPGSDGYMMKDIKSRISLIKPLEIVTLENHKTLYKNILYKNMFSITEQVTGK